MPVNPPAIVKGAEALQVAVDQVVRGFPRAHKYQVGADLRRDARTVMRCALRAWRAASLETIGNLSDAIDELKISAQLAKGGQAFKSFAQFEVIARAINDLGRQCGGWQKKHSSKGQSRQAVAPVGSATTLSARGASESGANL